MPVHHQQPDALRRPKVGHPIGLPRSFVWWVLVFCVLIVLNPIHGGLVYIYASTPITPPREFLWVPALFLLLFALTDTLVSRRFLNLRHPLTWGLGSMVVAGAFGVFAALLGWCVFQEGLPERSLWGLGWGVVGLRFVLTNLAGLLILFWFSLSSMGWLPLKHGQSRRILAAHMGVYLVCLVPYVASGALTHGRAGWALDCRPQMNALCQGLGRYALAHDERLPDSATMGEVFEQIRPYLDEPENWQGHPITICPEESGFSRDPKPYQWNPALAGKRIWREVIYDSPDRAVFRCPYHPGEYNVLRTEWAVGVWFSEARESRTRPASQNDEE